ncbi:MAG: hypothetical protein HYR48_06900 [Gemmatimonadetes bacterium]|nr:hypothetical protein [Gemmatimonadota bacterium]
MTALSLKLLLPKEIERLLPAGRRGVAFGVPALDAALPWGVPRGQITALNAPLGTGGTALLLALTEATLRADEGVALVDAERTLAPQAAAHLAVLGPFWVVRPKATESAWWCTDVLLRSGAFGLVIVDQAPAPARRVALRLQRIARDKGTALVVRTAALRSDGPGLAGLRPVSARLGEPRARPRRPPFATLVLTVHSRTDAAGFIPALAGQGGAWPAPRTLRVTIEKGGAPRAVEVTVGLPMPDRLRSHWAVRDRRSGGQADRRSKRRGTADRPTA